MMPRLRERLGAAPGMVAAMMVAATLLALVMAVVSAINDRPGLWRGPPDESNHRGAARYYVDHWLPPRVGDPATLGSYSLDYGYSYINDTDLTYLFAGKFAALISPLVPNHELGFRLFNVCLLGALAGFCLARPTAWLLFVPLVISPQVWYIFSYFNSDAFPLFLAILLAGQLVDPASRFNRYLDDPRFAGAWTGAVLAGVLVALLFLSKKNYYAFLALVPALVAVRCLGAASAFVLGAVAVAASGWYLGWLEVDRRIALEIAVGAALAVLAVALVPAASRAARLRVLGKLAILAAVAVAFAAPRYLWDAHANGSLEQKRLAIGRMQEQIAKPEYKPSLIFGEKSEGAYYGIDLRARGTRLEALFEPPWSWHVKTFSTATGSYGWLQYYGPLAYYELIAAGYAALFAVYGWAALRSRDARVVASFVLVSVFSALTVAIAVYASWAYDFQAQGRYLFPIAAMLGAGLLAAREQLQGRSLRAATLACFALSVYSFVFVGLAQVQRAF